MMDKERFKLLWQETIDGVSYEFTRQSNNGLVDIKTIDDFYRINIVEGLWFTDKMANDYNQWVAININSKEKLTQVYQSMCSVHFKARPSLIVIILLCIGLCVFPTGTVLLLMGLVPVGIPLMLIGIIILLLDFFLYRKKHSLIDFNTVKKELNLVGRNVEAIL